MDKQELIDYVGNDPAKFNEIKELLYSVSPFKQNPVDLVRWVPIEKVCANNYNPNSVARIEMNLLFVSIKHDGYTQPVVTFYDEKKDKYIIVDGFHRYSTMKNSKYLRELNHGYLPVVVIDKNIDDRMASTIRHNRARGTHSVQGMTDIVYKMLNDGWDDARICNELGMEPDELIRLKYVTGFAKLYEKGEFNKSWEVGFGDAGEEGGDKE